MTGRASRLIPLVIAAAGLQACATLAFYTQSINGQLVVLANRQPVAELTTDPSTPEALRQRLKEIEQIRAFAIAELGLPDNGSYRSYADLKRPFVLWNVFAAPEFSLTPLQWCFPFVGCVSYRGYFAEEDARQFAQTLTVQGYDVFVGGVAAYSTLGWFADPVLNTMLRWDKGALAKVIFHELAHQKLYIPDDTAFNEAFATAVAQTGVERWLAAQGDNGALTRFKQAEQRDLEFIALVLTTRNQLGSLYASSLEAAEMRAAKRSIFQDMRRAYEALKHQWQGYSGYEAWIASSLNNAKIASVVTYHERLAAFKVLFSAAHDEFERFYVLARLIGQLPPSKRGFCLDGLARHGPGFLSACFGLDGHSEIAFSP
ncbi:MAG TPA: aminopeptidase [Gammaproteobacteria bacterium]|nr:aminopeptidase [Gammaproteobacteria bacterium]